MTKIPFLSLKSSTQVVRTEIENSLKEILDSDWYLLGRFGTEFEKNYAHFNQVAHCIGVGNGLDALVLSLKALGIGPGDEVIVPSNTFIATALAVSYVGAKPVLVEPSSATYNIQSAAIEAKITPRTKAIIPVHLYGQACEMSEIMDLASRRQLFVIEDNAQAQGAQCDGHLTGAFGQINGTSFYPGKNLGAMGDAGAITTQDPQLAEKARMLRNYGSVQKYKHEVQGQNSRLDEFQAAILNLKLKHLPAWTQERQAIARRYSEHLQNLGDLIIPATAPSVTHVYHLYVIRTSKRNALQAHLTECGVETLIHYPTPIHLQGAYRELGHQPGAFPIAEELSATSLSLPLYPGLAEAQQLQVIDAIKSFYA